MDRKSPAFRLRAIACEQRAAKAIDQSVKWEWSELASQWHTLAREMARAEGLSGDDDIDFA